MFTKRKFFKPPLGAILVPHHQLASGLVGAWVFNENAGDPISLVNQNDVLAVARGASLSQEMTWGFSNGVPALLTETSIGSTLPYAQVASPSAAMKPTDIVSIVCIGVCHDSLAAGPDNPPMAGMNYTTTSTAPFLSYGIFRKSSGGSVTDDIFFADNYGGSLNTLATTGSKVVSGTTQMFSASAKTGSQIVYVNGRQSVTAAHAGSLSYGAGAFFTINSTNFFSSKEEAGWDAMAVYVYHRFLSADEHAWLWDDPYAMLRYGSQRSFVLLAPSTVSISETPTDSASLSDAIALGLGLGLTDTLSLSDLLVSAGPSFSLVLDGDLLQLSDTQQYGIGYYLQLTETLDLAEDQPLLNYGLIPDADQLSLTDSIIEFPGALVVLNDTISFTDAISIFTLGIFSENIADSFTFLDSLTVLVRDLLVLSLNDGMTLIDTIKFLMASAFLFSDNLALLDTLVTSAPGSNIFSDTVSLVDTAQLNIGVELNFSDALTLDDSLLAPGQPITVSVGDSLSFLDGLNYFETVAILGLSDSFHFVDHLNVAVDKNLTSYLRRYLNDVQI